MSPSHTRTACYYRLRCPEDSGLSCFVSPVDRDPARGSPGTLRPLVKEPEQKITRRFLSLFSCPPYSACLPRVGASSSPLVYPGDSSLAAPLTPWGSEFLHLYHLVCEIAFELTRLTLVANQTEEEALSLSNNSQVSSLDPTSFLSVGSHSFMVQKPLSLF